MIGKDRVLFVYDLTCAVPQQEILHILVVAVYSMMQYDRIAHYIKRSNPRSYSS